MKNILVTGGAGFIGSHTVVELSNSGFNPVIVDDLSNSESEVIQNISKIIKKPVIFYEHKYQDQKFLEDVILENRIDGVIHFAAYKAVGESVTEPLKYYDNNVAGLIQLLKVIEKLKITGLVFSSSCTVYGEPDKLPVTEESPLKPSTSPYGSTKQFCETIIRDTTTVSKTLRSVSLRYFNPIGAHPSNLLGELPKGIPANLVPFITQATAGLRDELVVNGNDYPTPDGTCIRDYIHVVDLAKAHVKSIEYLANLKPTNYDIFNIGTGKGSSVLDVVNSFEKVNNIKVPYKIGPRRIGDVIQTFASVDKANKQLGWKAERSLDMAMYDAWQWQKQLDRTS